MMGGGGNAVGLRSPPKRATARVERWRFEGSRFVGGTEGSKSEIGIQRLRETKGGSSTAGGGMPDGDVTEDRAGSGLCPAQIGREPSEPKNQILSDDNDEFISRPTPSLSIQDRAAADTASMVTRGERKVRRAKEERYVGPPGSPGYQARVLKLSREKTVRAMHAQYIRETARRSTVDKHDDGTPVLYHPPIGRPMWSKELPRRSRIDLKPPLGKKMPSSKEDTIRKTDMVSSGAHNDQDAPRRWEAECLATERARLARRKSEADRVDGPDEMVSRDKLVVQLAKEIMTTADGMSSNAELSVSEIRVFLANTQYEGFMNWIIGPSSGAAFKAWPICADLETVPDPDVTCRNLTRIVVEPWAWRSSRWP